MEGADLVSADLLDVRGLCLTRGTRPVLRGVHLSARRGEVVALMGLSGGGKTTTLRTVVALEPFDGGEIDVGGVLLRPGPVPRESRLRDLRRRVGMVFQLHHLFDHLTTIDNVTLAPVHAFGVARAEAERRAAELLDSLGVGHRARALPRELSGGEMQRVAIARALATDPPLLLLDEPTASLDPARRFDLSATLRRLAASGRGLVVTTHDVEFAQASADRAVVLAGGEVVEEGAPREVIANPAHPATREFLRSERPDTA
jgi:ABC-type polar amino acid transport system ATPase subunit